MIKEFGFGKTLAAKKLEEVLSKQNKKAQKKITTFITKSFVCFKALVDIKDKGYRKQMAALYYDFRIEQFKRDLSPYLTLDYERLFIFECIQSVLKAKNREINKI